MKRAGKQVPALDNRPSIPDPAWLWNAFFRLHTCRPLGFGVVGMIPWTSTEWYAMAHRLNEEDKYLLHEVIAHMDSIWLEHDRAQQSRRGKR